MHLGNGAITSECMVLTATAAACGLGVAAWSARRETPRPRAVAAGLAAAVFAMQAFNFPLWGGSSAHLLGGVLLAALIGPGTGAWLMAAVLTLQAALLGDGGLGAWGANIVQMALVPAALVAAGQRWFGEQTGRLSPLAAGLAGAASVLVAAGLIALETAAFRSGSELAHWGRFSALLAAAHLPVAVIEGLLTAAAVWALAPLVQRAAEPGRALPFAAAAFAWAGAVVAATPWSSTVPDGYEAAALDSGWAALLASDGLPRLAEALNSWGEPLALAAAVVMLAATSLGMLAALQAHSSAVATGHTAANTLP